MINWKCPPHFILGVCRTQILLLSFFFSHFKYQYNLKCPIEKIEKKNRMHFLYTKIRVFLF